MKKQFYVVAINKKDGSTAFIRSAPASSSTRNTTALTSDASMAHMFPIDYPKEDIIVWVDKATKGISRYADLDSLKIMIFETLLHTVDMEDIEWKTALQRNGVGKLTTLEVRSMGLEKYEIERRLSLD
jgi:hypothetical protein